jgi:hypothetical protein
VLIHIARVTEHDLLLLLPLQMLLLALHTPVLDVELALLTPVLDVELALLNQQIFFPPFPLQIHFLGLHHH